MTETSLCHSVTVFYDEQKSHKYAYESIGRGIPYSETKVVDPESGRLVPLNTDGELHIRGPHVFAGYWDEPEKTSETIDKNKWLEANQQIKFIQHDF
jgi:fatty-acyl-CoA synthase